MKEAINQEARPGVGGPGYGLAVFGGGLSAVL